MPSANALDVEKAVKAKMAELAKAFPQDSTTTSRSTPRPSSRQSINEVYQTLLEAGLLVFLIILIFLQDWRATLIPTITIPVSLIGAFAVMAAFGFTINLIDAVRASCSRSASSSTTPSSWSRTSRTSWSRACRAEGRRDPAMEELFGADRRRHAGADSVFLPASFLPGLTGQMYSQFALVIAATALLSAINAATLKPTQCAMWLRRPQPPEQRNWFYRGFNAVYDRVERGYARLVGRLVAHSNRVGDSRR